MRTRVLKPVGVYLMAMLLAAVVAEPAPAQGPADGWGLQPGQPVEVCKLPGQRAWLAQLRCADGSELSWRRTGNVGSRVLLSADLPVAELEKYISGAPLAAGEPDHHVIDAYQVDCGGQVTVLYLDMYHCEAPPPTHAPAGFELAP